MLTENNSKIKTLRNCIWIVTGIMFVGFLLFGPNLIKEIYGNGESVWYNYRKDGSFPDTPTEKRHFNQGVIYFNTMFADDINFKEEMEKYSPLQVLIENTRNESKTACNRLINNERGEIIMSAFLKIQCTTYWKQ